ncbi:MAG TPA: AbrB/MazE/SpoVT family DNA-binding domain-containing protein [Solirubrobacteraceae bacterium]|jgi:AbrB family looped-hinge helix DNA binding protein|nr:AbrB/MazE/SpoVT family DNA-binding domain-containing protein [Solirubrobacteraceae bacterium]
MSKVSSKHQVTLPVRVLEDAGLEAGDEVVIRVVGRGRIEVERAEDVIDRYAGSLPSGTYPPGYLNQLRDEWRA